LIVLVTFQVLTSPGVCWKSSQHLRQEEIVKTLTDVGFEVAAATLKAVKCVEQMIQHSFPVNAVQQAIARFQEVVINLNSDPEKKK
jgi:hypothetical protein